MSVAIWWIRRDLRLFDNPALEVARRRARHVIPLWIFDPHLLQSPYVGQKRLAFLLQSLRRMQNDLEERGSNLIVRSGEPMQVLKALQAESGAATIVAQADYSPYARARDRRVGDLLPLHLTSGVAVHPPGSVRKANGDPYVVYSPFARTWRDVPAPRSEELLPAPEKLSLPENVGTEDLPETPHLPDDVPFAAGAEEGRRRLDAFLARGAAGYARLRDRLDRESTSGLSPYLRFGIVSPRAVAVRALQALSSNNENHETREGIDAWLNELIWRDFFLHVLYHFPQARQGAFRQKYAELAWRNGEEEFEAWCQGRTGYPVVDAAMRQLQQTGWLHNRARLIVGSFLVKDLLIDWRWGERYFMQHLIDGDPALNNGNWQWIAGTGTDAAPYFRIFNPVSQGKKHDPRGRYVRRWLPELRDVPDGYVHEPWRMPSHVQRSAGCFIGREYPAPIVDHQKARQRALATFKDVG